MFLWKIIVGSIWMFILAICFGFQNVEGILNFIGIFWVVFFIGCIIYGFRKSAKEEQENLDDLRLTSFKDGEAKALSVIEKLKWTPTGSMQSREKRYVTFRYSQNNIDDFDWLVKYISYYGSHAEFLDPNYKHNKYIDQEIMDNPYATIAKTIGDSLFKCTMVNSDYTTNEIYRIPKTDIENRKIVESRYAIYEELNTTSSSGRIDVSSDNIIGAAQQLKAQYQHLLTDIKEDAEEVKPIEEQDTLLLEGDNNNHKSSNQQDKQRAIDILNMQLWEKLNILDKGRVQYVCRKEHAPNPDDFKWVVGYLSGIGTPENCKNPHTYVITKLDGVEYKSIKVNKYFEGTVIYKMGENGVKIDDLSMLEQMDKLSLSIKKAKAETRFKSDPIVQLNMQLINEKRAELRQKKQEYIKLRNRNEDETFISLYSSGLIDIEEYEQQLEDLKDEIEELKDEIEELKYEIDEIKEEIEDEIEDEEWEREMTK